MIELIPAIDIIGGECVRLSQGSFDRKKVYAGKPEDVALRFEQLGIRRLHLVDLDGARAGHVVNLDVLETIAERTSLVVDFGGGLKSDDDVRRVFNAGAAMITAGSVAVKDPELVKDWLEVYGPSKIILGADARNGLISVSGWQERTSLELPDFIRSWTEAGIQKIICTDIGADGMLEGPNVGLYRELTGAFPQCELIASGGVSDMNDIRTLEEAGVSGVIFGKAYYEGKITDTDIINFLKPE